MIRNVTLALPDPAGGLRRPLAAQPADPPVSMPEPAVDRAAAPAVPRTMVGTWEFSNADREKTCAITFRNESNRGRQARRLRSAPAPATLPFVQDVAAWQFADDDFLKLLDAQGNSAARVQRGRERHLRGAAAGRGHPVHPERIGARARAQDRRADHRRLDGHPPHRPGDLRAVADQHAAGEEFVGAGRAALRSGRRAVRAGDVADGSRRDRAARGERPGPCASRRARTRSGCRSRRPPIRCCWCESSRVLISGARKLERMRDGRAVYIGAERVDDVTAHPAFREGANTIAGLYDLKADPAQARAVLVRGGRRAAQPLLAALPQPRRSRAPHALLQGDRRRDLRLRRPFARPGVGADHRACDESGPARRPAPGLRAEPAEVLRLCPPATISISALR